MNNKFRKALYSIKGFFKNSHIPIPYKQILFFFCLHNTKLGKFSIMYLYLYLTKKEREVYKH